MQHGRNLYIRLLKEHFWGILLLVVILVVSAVSVNAWKAKHPGAMTVLESQAMDMTVMKPPVGATPVATEVVHLGQFTAKVTYTGSVAPLQEQVIYPRVEGSLRNLNAYNGDTISQGQIIAVVDSPDLQTKVAEAAAGQAAALSEVPAAQADVARMAAERSASQGEIQAARSEVARANAMVSAAQRGVAQRQQDIKSAKANLEYWKAEIARQERLYKTGAVSLQELQSERSQATAAEAELESKQSMLEEAKANVEAAQADVSSKKTMVSVAQQKASAASASLASAGQMVRQKAAMARQAGAMVATASTIDQYRYVRAPFAGMLTKRYVSPGQFVTPSTAIASVVQMDKVRLQANVSDRDVDGIKPGAFVVAHFTKDPSLTINAMITSVSPQSDQSSRTAVVEAIVPNPGHKLVPGDAVTLDIAVSGNSTTISIPQSAVVQRDGMTMVWVARVEAPKGKMLYTCTMHPEVVSEKPGDCPKCNMRLVPKTSSGNKKAHLMMVTSGAGDGDRVQISGGLSDGDEIIYQGHTYLKEGDTIFPTKWGEDGPEAMPAAPGMGDMPGMPGMKSGSSDNMDNMPGMDHGSGDMKGMPGMKQGSGSMDNMPGMDHSKMKLDAPKQGPKEAKGQKLYQCPMHPHEMSHNPKDKCKLCGMFIDKEVKK